jgi:hypothetical protein
LHFGVSDEDEESSSSLELEPGSLELELKLSELEPGLLELELGLLELEPGSLELEAWGSGSWSSEPEHANNVKATARSVKMECLRTARRVLWVMVLPRNIVAKHLMMLRALASFPASVFDRHGSGTALGFHKVTLRGWFKYSKFNDILFSPYP